MRLRGGGQALTPRMVLQITTRHVNIPPNEQHISYSIFGIGKKCVISVIYTYMI